MEKNSEKTILGIIMIQKKPEIKPNGDLFSNNSSENSDRSCFRDDEFEKGCSIWRARAAADYVWQQIGLRMIQKWWVSSQNDIFC